jgi:hypothetical protein
MDKKILDALMELEAAMELDTPWGRSVLMQDVARGDLIPDLIPGEKLYPLNAGGSKCQDLEFVYVHEAYPEKNELLARGEPLVRHDFTTVILHSDGDYNVFPQSSRKYSRTKPDKGNTILDDGPNAIVE